LWGGQESPPKAAIQINTPGRTGGQKPGFLQKYFVTNRRNGKKPGYEGFEA
jgi:hypothetical protein